MVSCSRGVVVRYNRVELKVPGSSPAKYLVFFPSFFLFFAFFVLLFPINMRLNNCDLIECSKQKEKYRVSRENIVYRIWNIWINNVNFYHFLQFTVGKPELITIWSFSKQRSHDFFYILRVIITFQHVNWTHSMSFSILLSLTQADGSLSNSCQYQQNVPQYYSLLDTLVTWE